MACTGDGPHIGMARHSAATQCRSRSHTPTTQGLRKGTEQRHGVRVRKLTCPILTPRAGRESLRTWPKAMEGDGGRGTSRGRQAGWSRSGTARAGEERKQRWGSNRGSWDGQGDMRGGAVLTSAARRSTGCEEPARCGARRTGAQRTNTMRVPWGRGRRTSGQLIRRRPPAPAVRAATATAAAACIVLPAEPCSDSVLGGRVLFDCYLTMFFSHNKSTNSIFYHDL